MGDLDAVVPNPGEAALQRVVTFLGHQVAEPDRAQRVVAEAEAALDEAALVAADTQAELEEAAAEHEDDAQRSSLAERMLAELEAEAVRRARAEVAASQQARTAAELREKSRASQQEVMRLTHALADAEQEVERRARAVPETQRSFGLVSGDWKQAVVQVPITELLALIEARRLSVLVKPNPT